MKKPISTNKQAWIVSLSACLFFFFEMFQMNMFNTLSPALLKAFSLQATGLGVFSAFYFYGNLLLLFPAGVLYDRFSPRKLLVYMMLLSIVSTMCFAVSHNLWLSVLCRAIAGACNAFSFVGCLRIVSDRFKPNNSALVIGVMVTLGLFGGMMAQVPLAQLMLWFDWRIALLICSLVALMLWCITWLNVQDFPSCLEKSSKGVCKNRWTAYANPQNWLCGIYTAFLNMPVSILGALWNNLYLTQSEGLSVMQASMITSMIFLGVMLGSPVIGWISDITKKRKPLMFLGVVLSMLTIWVIIHLSPASINSYLLCYFILGFVSSAQTLGYPLLASHNKPAIISRAYSLMAFLVIVTGAITQPLVGWLLNFHWSGDMHGGVPLYSYSDYHFALMLIPVAFAVSLLCILLLKENKE